MKILQKFISALVTVIFAGYLIANGQDQSTKPNEAQIPLIQMQGVTVKDAIKNLGEQAEISFMIDPKITDGAQRNAASRKLRSPVTIRWKNLSAKEALARLVKERGLYMIENPQTGVTKFTATNSPPRVFDKEFLDTAKEVIEVVRMDGVPLERAFSLLQEKGNWKLDFNEKLLHPYTEEIFVSVNFKNLTASQALAAICEQYDLDIAKSKTAGAWSISRR